MKAINAALQAVLDAGPPWVVADLFTLTFADASVVRWATSQKPLTLGGETFNVGPPIERDKARWKIGLAVDQMAITIIDDGTATVAGQPLVAAVWKNLFDYVAVTVERFISDSWSNLAPDKNVIFVGKAGDVGVEKKTITLTVDSQLAQLQATFPRTFILPSCAHTLYDGGCALLEATFTKPGTVGAAPTATVFTLSGVAEADGYFALGKVKFTSGPNDGQIRAVKSYIGGVITLNYPLYTVPDVGDGVDAIAGCDKTSAVCFNRFANLDKWRAFPFVPDPSAQLGTAGASPGGRKIVPIPLGALRGSGGVDIDLS